MSDIILPGTWGKALLDQPEKKTSAIPELPGPPTGMVDCACAKKHIPLGEVKFHDTPFVKGATDTICDECLKNVQKFALIVCLGCKGVVARVPPSVQPNGFRFEPNGKYHIKRCPNCVQPPGTLAKSTVVEAEVFAIEMGRVNKTFSHGNASNPK